MTTGKTVVILQSTIDKLNEVTPTPVAREVSTMDNFLELVGLVILLIIILIAAYYATRFIGGIKLGQMRNSNFQVIDTYRISSNKVMQIVKVGNRFVVIGIGKDSINYITELTEDEVIIRDDFKEIKPDFKQIFEKLRSKTDHNSHET